MTSARFRAYWNDEARERSKPYWVERADDPKLIAHVRTETNLQKCFEDALRYAESQFDALRGTVLDLGAGVCWTSSLLSRHAAVLRVVAYDYSEHRLMRVAPVVFRQFDAVEAKIERYCQPMYPLPHESESVDLVVFCQSLYMNDNPQTVMNEAARVLRPGGVVVIACEQIEQAMGTRRLLRELRSLGRHPYRAWSVLSTGRLVDESGRRRYLDTDYASMVRGAGLTFARQSLDYPVFKGTSVPAANFFGSKPSKESRD